MTEAEQKRDPKKPKYIAKFDMMNTLIFQVSSVIIEGSLNKNFFLIRQIFYIY